MSEKEAIGEMIRRITQAWREGRFDELTDYFDPDMVLAMPGFGERVTGRKPIIDSYREFDNQATIHDFNADEPMVDVFEGTAVATTAFGIGYSFGGKKYTERGTDVLVFRRSRDGWRVVWRTVVMSQ